MNTVALLHRDISPDFVWNPVDAAIATRLLDFEGTPRAIQYFAEVCDSLTDYSYWFLLGTLWVSYSGWSDLRLWKRLFKSTRPRRETSLMKPSELRVFKALPETVTAYRAHRNNETDWISYTLDRGVAKRFARERGVTEFVEYRLAKADVLALFLRRGEQELIMLNPTKAVRIAVHQVES
jgi:hypothetical protein